MGLNIKIMAADRGTNNSYHLQRANPEMSPADFSTGDVIEIGQ